jgi:hypothetical protein
MDKEKIVYIRMGRYKHEFGTYYPSYGQVRKENCMKEKMKF